MFGKVIDIVSVDTTLHRVSIRLMKRQQSLLNKNPGGTFDLMLTFEGYSIKMFYRVILVLFLRLIKFDLFI